MPCGKTPCTCADKNDLQSIAAQFVARTQLANPENTSASRLDDRLLRRSLTSTSRKQPGKMQGGALNRFQKTS